MFNEIHFEWENNCLLNCKHCSSLDMRQKRNTKGYLTEDIKNVIDLLAEPIYLYFTGGEPLLNPELHEVMNYISLYKSNINIGVFTSGIVEKANSICNVSYEEAIKLKESGLNNCYVSIYGEDEKAHDNMTNKKGIFNYAIETMKNFMKAGIDVKVHLVINKYNINKLDNIII